MSHDLVSPVAGAALAAVSAHPAEERPAAAVPQPPHASRALPNPSLRLDAGLGMVVLEFRDDSGKITGSIPSQRILEAYRSHAEPVPDGLPAPSAPTPAPGEDGEESPGQFA